MAQRDKLAEVDKTEGSELAVKGMSFDTETPELIVLGLSKCTGLEAYDDAHIQTAHLLTGRLLTTIMKRKAMPMQYMLQFRESPEERAKPNDPAQVGAYWGGWQAYIGALAQSGAMIGGNVLRPPETATTLRVENGTRHVVDGPFADTKEQLAGFVILNVPDIDAALEWAARAPCATGGSVEVRSVLPPPAS